MNFIKRAQQRLFAKLFDLQGRNPGPKRLESFINWLIIANLLALLLEHIPVLYSDHKDLFALFDEISIYIFSIEYVLRLLSAAADPKYAGRKFATVRHLFNPFSIIDFLVIAPHWLRLLGIVELDLRALRILRLLRLLKLMREIIPAIIEFSRANRGRSFREKIDSLMNETHTSGRLHQQLDLILIFVIVLSVVCVFLETVPEIHEPLALEFHYLDLFSVGVFSVEFLLRLYASPERLGVTTPLFSRLAYLRKPATLVDLIAVLPFYLQVFVSVDLRFVRILRVLRVAKLSRYNTAMKTFSMVMAREKRAFAAAMFVTLLITILAAAVVYEAEHAVQPDKYDTMFRAMYWAVITLASVGYGDISPVTPVGQAFTMVLAILGIGIVALPAGILGSAFSDQLQQDREEMLKEIEAAFADGILTDEEAENLEQERIRLHLSEEQFDALKKRAVGHVAGIGIDKPTLEQLADMVSKTEAALTGLPLERAVEEINKLDISEKQKASLKSLL
jgi:hypothetical protein